MWEGATPGRDYQATWFIGATQESSHEEVSIHVVKGGGPPKKDVIINVQKRGV